MFSRVLPILCELGFVFDNSKLSTIRILSKECCNIVEKYCKRWTLKMGLPQLDRLIGQRQVIDQSKGSEKHWFRDHIIVNWFCLYILSNEYLKCGINVGSGKEVSVCSNLQWGIHYEPASAGLFLCKKHGKTVCSWCIFDRQFHAGCCYFVYDIVCLQAEEIIPSF